MGTTQQNNSAFQQALDKVHQLSPEEQQRLIEQVSKELEVTQKVKLLALGGIWKGLVDLSAEEIDQARKACWKGLET